MINLMDFEGYKAVIGYDPEIEMFRGEFIGLNGGADFYAKDIDGLRNEGSKSLKIFLKACEERGLTPRKVFSSKDSMHLLEKPLYME